MNTFMNGLTNATNFTRTENGALAHKTTRSAVYDMFAVGGAYRQRSDEDCIVLFKNALAENEELALKCLFYLRDCRGGQGERRFFRTCFSWLANHNVEAARRNLVNVSEYGRWDDLIYATYKTKVWEDAMSIIKTQLALDVECKTPSLLAKWLPSENASSYKTKEIGGKVREYLGMTHREYRKTLSVLRQRINVLERLMSANRWDEIEFDKIPSKAGLIYKNAFARRDIIAKKYETFAKSETTKVNAKTLFPYDVVHQAVGTNCGWSYRFPQLSEVDKAMIEKYWTNLPDYLNGKPCKMMCMVDTSGSMTGSKADAPLNVAIALGMYCAERVGGPFKNHYISFSSRPQLIKIEGVDFVDKVRRIYKTNLCENTNLEAAFEMLLKIAKKPSTKKEDIPETLVVISDMQIDSGTIYGGWTSKTAMTEMERMRARWEAAGLKCPKLVYWNVNASKDTILDEGTDVTFVSGCSPVIFEQVLTGVTGYELMLKKLMSERYANKGSDFYSCSLFFCFHQKVIYLLGQQTLVLRFQNGF